ncbi:MAG TPA: phage tail sheath C-terminal domain-containing protein [Fimbriimonadaceae bacterium]|nr:phage tail sheath C-terminal domain-containing protein [Fimbriimonadaceae bacterium]
MPRATWITALAVLLFGTISCGGGGPKSNPAPGRGATYSEQALGRASLFIADSVIVSLETAQGPALAGDTGDRGVDVWTFRVGESLDASFGSLVPDVQLSLFDATGRQVVSVGESASSIHLQAGTYRLEVRNLGSVPKTILVGWRDPGGRSVRFKNPGVYVTEIDSSLPPIAGLQTSIAAFIGTAAYIGEGPAPDYMEITRYSELTANFATPLDGYLDDAVRLFFLNGGRSATIIPIADATLNSHRGGLAVVEGLVGVSVQSVSAPDSVRLSVQDWIAFVLDANRATATEAMFVADPPREARNYGDVAGLQDALVPLEEPSGVVMYFPWLLDDAGAPVPPSGALLGVWAASDAEGGVWATPAGLAFPIQGVSAPEVLVTNEQIGQLEFAANGRSVCALVKDPMNGNAIAWGARTMDGNSDDLKYISFRRTLTTIEESIETTLLSFVFAPNNANTWNIVVAALSDFLNGFWLAGGLKGNTAADAYRVACELGATMTSQDLLDGWLRVDVDVAIMDPGVFIGLEFEQQIAPPSSKSMGKNGSRRSVPRRPADAESVRRTDPERSDEDADRT